MFSYSFEVELQDYPNLLCISTRQRGHQLFLPSPVETINCFCAISSVSSSLVKQWPGLGANNIRHIHKLSVLTGVTVNPKYTSVLMQMHGI